MVTLDRIPYIVAVVAIAAVLSMAIVRVMPGPAPQQTAARAETVIEETMPAPKADRLSSPGDDRFETHTVRIIPVAPLFQPVAAEPKFEPVPAPVVAQTEFPSLPQPKVTKSKPERGDICARHGMVRKDYDGGKRWRCVKK